MKKRITVIMFLLLAASFISCGQKIKEEDKKLADQLITGSQTIATPTPAATPTPTATPTPIPIFDVDTSKMNINNDCCNISKQKNGYFTFDKEGGVPMVYDGARYFGIYVSDSIEAKQNIQSAKINIVTKEISSEDSLIIEARGCKNGSDWSEWYQTDENNTNPEFGFYEPYQYIQFRVTIAIFAKESKPRFKINSLKLRLVSE